MTKLAHLHDDRGNLKPGASPMRDGGPGKDSFTARRMRGPISVKACERAMQSEAETAAALWKKRMGTERWDDRRAAAMTFDEIYAAHGKLQFLRALPAESSY